MLQGLLLLGSYLLGTMPSALVVGRQSGHDPTSEGSGNPGASNIYRLAGARAGAIVLVVDLAKGSLAAAVGYLVGDRQLAAACGFAAVIGHVVPFYRPLRGGKGVATAAGMSLVLWPLAGAVLGACFVAIAAVIRKASVGSLAIATGLPLCVAVFGRPGWEVAAAAGVALVIVLRHHSNIRRLVRGEEPVTTPRPARTGHAGSTQSRVEQPIHEQGS